MAEAVKEFSLKRSQFACPSCKGEAGQGAFFFFALAEDIRQNENNEYVADCPQCGAPCAELWYMGNVRKAQGKQTGPRSQAGKDKVRANGYRTGSSYMSGAIPKVLPPAKPGKEGEPGKYAECDTCQDIETCKEEVAAAHGTSRFVVCHRQSEVFARYRAAHLSGDPEALRMTAADNQAQTQLVLNQCFKAVFDNGVMLESTVVSGGLVTVDKKINPAINESTKILEKMGFTLTDWVLTPKSKESKAALEGYLAGRAVEKGQTVDQFMTETKKAIADFQGALERGNVAVQNDATRLEAEAEEQETPESV